MSLQKTVLGILNVRSGEGQRVSWLVAHSLFIGLFAAFFLTSANALFLDRFELSALPVAYLATGVVGYLFLVLFSRLQKAFSLQWTLLLNAAFLLVLVATLWLLVLTTRSAAVVFFLFVCVGPAFSLLALGFWALAGRLFDLRQGKRLFGLVGAGEEVSTVVGLFTVPLIVRGLGGPVHLLPIALVGLVGCLVIVVATGVQFKTVLASGPGPAQPARSGETRSALGRLLRSRYFLLLASLIVFLNLGHYMVDFGFLSQVRSRFQGPTVLAQLIAVFYGVTKILELLTKVFLSGRLLNQFGLKFGLLAMPTLLLACGGFAIVIGTLGLPEAHFFVLVALSKLLWLVSRTTTFEPSFRVLYQPVGADKLAFQTHAEGTARHLATGVVGVGLMVFSRSPSFNALNLFYALLPLLVAWIYVSVRAHRDYRLRLLESLTDRGSSPAAETPLTVLRAQLTSGGEQDRQHAFSLLERTEGAAFVARLSSMLTDSDPALRSAVLEYVAGARLADLDEQVTARLADEEPEVREAARRAKDALREVEEIGRDGASALATSPEAGDRALAAETIGRVGGEGSTEALWMMLFDPDWTVRRAALVAAGRLGRSEFWPQIIGELDSPVLSRAATGALVAVGDRALPEAERAFNKADQLPAVRQRILHVYETMGSPKALAALANKLAFPDEAVRARSLAALSRVRYQAGPEQALAVARAIEALVARTAWNMSAVLDLRDDERLAEVVRTLDEEIEEARGNLLRLLALLYDPWAIGLVKENIESASSETIAYALEILDLLLSDELKEIAFPLLESQGYGQTLRRLEATFPRHRMAPLDRLSAIVNRDYDRIGIWSRALALQAMAQLAGRVVPDLVASLFHPEPLMQDVAAHVIRRLDPAAYARHHAKLSYEARARLDGIMGPDDTLAHWESRSVLGRAQTLRRMPAFAGLPSSAIVRVASASEDLVLNQKRRLPSPRAPRESFYVNLAGDIALVEGEAGPCRVPLLSLIAFGPGSRAIEVCETARFIRIEPAALFEVANEHVALIATLRRAERQILDEEGGGPRTASPDTGAVV